MNEKWREVYTEEQIKKIQQIELENLEVFDSVCKKLNIEYFLYGGTLIGAVRHKGFVPWDDDLDVAMSRDDYMRFVHEAHAFLPEGYYLQTPYTDKKTPYLYSKLRKKGTACIEFIHHKLDIEKGIYIDIYPIDNVTDDDDEYMAEYSEYQKLARRYVLRQCKYPSVEGKSFKRRIKNVLRYMASTVVKIIPQSYFVKKADAILTKHNSETTGRKGNLFYPEPTNVFCDLYPLEDGVFEGIPVKLPGNWDKHLTSRYGDYMEFPPEDERIGHKPYILDLGE